MEETKWGNVLCDFEGLFLVINQSFFYSKKMEVWRDIVYRKVDGSFVGQYNVTVYKIMGSYERRARKDQN